MTLVLVVDLFNGFDRVDRFSHCQDLDSVQPTKDLLAAMLGFCSAVVFSHSYRRELFASLVSLF